MSRENVELVRRGYQAFNDRDLDALLANFTDDVEWRLIGGFADLMGAEFKGHEALRGFFNEWLENLGGQVEMETALEADDQVVVVMRTVGAGGASSAPAEMRWGQVYSFRGGQVSEVDNYYEASDALNAVGLGEEATSQKVDTVRAMYDAAGRRDLDGAVRCLHPDVELRPALEPLEHGPLIRGRDGVREFWEDLGTWESLRVEFKETIEAGDRLLVHEHWHVRGRENIELDFEISDLFTFRDGLVVRVDGFADEAEAVAALG